MLKFTVVDPEGGTTGTQLGPYAVGDSVFHLLTRDEALLVVFRGESGGIQLAELPLTESGPIDAGLPPPDECPNP